MNHERQMCCCYFKFSHVCQKKVVSIVKKKKFFVLTFYLGRPDEIFRLARKNFKGEKKKKKLRRTFNDF